MSVKFHINPDTGRANVCRAEKRECPIGGEHFDSKEEARAGYERQMSESNVALASIKKERAERNEVPVRDLAGLEIVNRETGEVEGYTTFSSGELGLPGYLESVERGYEDSKWFTRRVSRSASTSEDALPEQDPYSEWCSVCSRATDHTGEHDGLVEAGMAVYGPGGAVSKTETYDSSLARKIEEAEYSYYTSRLDAQEESEEVTRLRGELAKLENSPARYQSGFPEDEMIRYNVEQAIKAKQDEIRAVLPSYDPEAEKAAAAAEKGLNNAVATARFQSDPKRAYKAFPVYKLPEPGGKAKLYSTAVASVQYNKVNPGVTPNSYKEIGTKTLLIPNMGRMTSGRMLTIANELARLSDKNLEEWDAMSADARIRWAESRIGKPRDIDLSVHEDGRVSFFSKYSTSSNYAPEDVIVAKYPG